MDYVKFGKTGLDVSRLCIGCMTYGIPDRGAHPWTLDEEKSRPLIKQAVESGINFFDTANVLFGRHLGGNSWSRAEGVYAPAGCGDRNQGLSSRAAGA